MRGLNRGHGRDHRVDAADVAAPADPVVPVLAPALTPRVLYDPVGLLLEADGGVACGAVADEKNTVV